MGEIDDLYKSESEVIDSSFLEELKTTKDHEKSFKTYRKNLKKSRDKFSKKYGKFNAVETRKIRKMKKKLPKNKKFERLNVKHFNFNFGFWERLKMKLDIGFFVFMRKTQRFVLWIFPDWLAYEWFKIVNFFRGMWGDLARDSDYKWENMKTMSVKTGAWIWDSSKAQWGKVVSLSGKILFWKKGKKSEGDDGKGSEGDEEEKGKKEGEGEKEGEEKKEGE